MQLDDASITYFKRWIALFPCAVSSKVEQNTAYVKCRCATHDWFESRRGELRDMRDTLEVMKSGGVTSQEALEVKPILEAVMSAQWLARGLLCSREHYKAKDLLLLCRDLIEALVGFGYQGSAFWRLLCYSSLGHAHLAFRKYPEAGDLLKQGLEAAAQHDGSDGLHERLFTGLCYAHLSSVHLEAEDFDEAVRCADLGLEIFERDLWSLLDERQAQADVPLDDVIDEDKELLTAILATAYLNRGTCDVRRGNFDSGLSWYSSAKQCLHKNGNLGHDNDNDEILKKLQEFEEHARHLQHYTSKPGLTESEAGAAEVASA
mmetsp:Transcript_54405/g.100511  ORF Transcript_54405/g.100511 Transcript_54405/m.100511 type:complete len:319 (+) Transcript_54405:70-1026(+)